MKLFKSAGSVTDTEVTLEAIESHCAGAVQMRSQYCSVKELLFSWQMCWPLPWRRQAEKYLVYFYRTKS